MSALDLARTHHLRFTGAASAEEFARRCAEQDYWYHTFRFDNGYRVRGDYDIGHDIEAYGFPKDLTGMSVLDVGTGSGWFATFFEQAGATVTTVDARGYTDFDVRGRFQPLPIAAEKSVPDRYDEEGRAVYYSPVSRGFWIMKEMLGLRAVYRNARIYELAPGLFGGQEFDLVFLGSLLMHVRDPVGALMAARSVCRGLLVTNSLMPKEDDPAAPPVMELLNAEGRGTINWWRPNRACLLEMVRAAGFREAWMPGTVALEPDQPFADSVGFSSALRQRLYLVHARP